MAKNQSKIKKVEILNNVMDLISCKTELPPKYSRMTTMSEVFLWNYPGLWNCILMCILRWYSFRFFQVQFSKSFLFLTRFSFLVTQLFRADFGDFLQSNSAINFVKHSTCFITKSTFSSVRIHMFSFSLYSLGVLANFNLLPHLP